MKKDRKLFNTNLEFFIEPAQITSEQAHKANKDCFAYHSN